MFMDLQTSRSIFGGRPVRKNCMNPWRLSHTCTYATICVMSLELV